MSLPKPEPITFAERLATAFISAIAASLTLFAYFVVNVALAAKSGSGQLLVSSLFFSKLSAYIIGAATLAGFLVGSQRMVGVFSFFWGTHEIWEREWFQKLCIALLIAIIAAIVVRLLHSNHA